MERNLNISVSSFCEGKSAKILADFNKSKHIEDELHKVNRALKILSECTQAVLRAVEELEVLNEICQVPGECNQAVLCAVEESELLHEVCRIIVKVGEYRVAWVSSTEEDKDKTVRPVLLAGYGKDYLDIIDISRVDTESGSGPTRRVALPLIAHGQTLGVLNIYAAEPDAFDPQEVSLLTQLANYLAYGISSLRERAEFKQAKEALIKFHQVYEKLVNTIDGIVWEADAQTLQFYFVSKQAERLLGYSIQCWLKEAAFFENHLHPDDRERVIALLKKTAAEKKTHKFEFRMLADDGRPVWLRNTFTVFVKDDKPIRLCGVMLNITERKRLKETIRKAYEQIEQHIEQFAILIEGTKNPLAVIDGLARIKGDETSKKINKQVERIEKILKRIDSECLDAEKVKDFLKKHWE